MNLPETIWTIGHSTRSAEEFLALLAGNGIQALADVRRFPGSRKYPHFNVEPLAHALHDAGIDYVPFPELGGRRKPLPDSPNTAWRNDAFRGYADYMRTPEFTAGMERLATLASARRTAIMCSEAVWWRCHRGLISDWSKVRGVRVLHILDARQVVEHPYTSAAHVTNGELDYGAAKA
jgi:uncharacterized protein (DUF488 family)